MRITFIRHGQSVANREGIFQGQMDFPLSDEGYKQAQLVGKWLKDEPIEVLYTSDLSRAVETAQCIGTHHDMDPIVRKDLRERGLGEFEGLPRSEIEQKYPQFAHADWFTTGVGGVETFREAQERSASLIDELWQQHAGQRVVCVSHGMFIGVTLMTLLGLDWPGRRVFTFSNTGMTTLTFEARDHCLVLGVNETPHLAYAWRNA